MNTRLATLTEAQLDVHMAEIDAAAMADRQAGLDASAAVLNAGDAAVAEINAHRRAA